MKIQGYMTMVGAILINTTTVSMYLFGNLSTYLVSYVRLRLNSTVVISDGMWIAASSSVAFGVGNIPITKIAHHLGPKQIIIVGCFVISGGVLSSYLTIKKSLKEVVLTFGFTAHIGFSVMYLLPGCLGIKQNPRNRKLIGIVNVTATAVGALLFNETISGFINPENISPGADGYFTDDKLIDRVPYVFLVLGAIYLGLQIIGSILLALYVPLLEQPNDAQIPMDPNIPTSSKPTDALVSVNESVAGTSKDTTYGSTEDEDKKTEDAGEPGSKTKAIAAAIKKFLKSKDDDKSLPDVDFKQVFQHKEFYIIYILNFLHTQTYFIISNTYKPYAFTFNRNDHAVVAIGSIAAVVGIMGRVIWFLLMKRVSYKVLIITKSVTNAVLLGTLYLAQSLGTGLFIAWIFVIYFMTGAMFVMSPFIVSLLFGSRNMKIQNGAVLTQYVLSGITIVFGTNYLHDIFYSYKSIFIALCVAEALSAVLTLLLPNDPLALRQKLVKLPNDITLAGIDREMETQAEDTLTISNML